MKTKQLLLIAGILASFLSTSNALEGEYISSDFKTTSYFTRCVKTESQKEIFRSGQVAMNAILKEFTGNLFPKSFSEETIIQEMTTSIENRRSFDRYLKFIDDYMAETNQGNNSTLSITEKSYTPRGYLIFYGGSRNLGVLKSVGASTNLALIIVPRCQTTWDKKSGQIIDEQIQDFDFKLSVNPAIGMGKKIGVNIAQARFGIGFIFDPNHNLNNASDFFGAGVSASKSSILGNLPIAGKYLKAGTIVNLKLNYFPFVMAGKATGSGAATVSNFGGLSFLDLSFLSNIFIKLTESEIQKLNEEVRVNLNDSLQGLPKQDDIQQHSAEPKQN